MCLIAFALGHHREYPLILVANRDEFHDRPTESAAFWPEYPQLLAGRDLRGGGTWLGVTKSGRIAAVTNFREPLTSGPSPLSRGILVRAFLTASQTPEAFLKQLKIEGAKYGGFNLIFGTVGRLFYYSNRGTRNGRIATGIHGLSNHLLDSPWPKVVAARERLEQLIRTGIPDPEAIMGTMADAQAFQDEQLPDTGVGIELERFLSPLFIKGESYGTRSTTVLLLDRGNTLTFMERSYNHHSPTTVRKEFRLL